MRNTIWACVIEKGEGVPVDHDKAMELYTKAAEQFIEEAIEALIEHGSDTKDSPNMSEK